jgi:hypothetical protein
MQTRKPIAPTNPRRDRPAPRPRRIYTSSVKRVRRGPTREPGRSIRVVLR